MNIRLADNSDRLAWDEYVQWHSEGLAYHQFAWKKAVAEAYDFESRYLLAEKNREICGVLPLIVFKRPFSGHRYISLPYCDIGGCLANDGNIESLLVAKAEALGISDGVVGVELRTGSKLGSEDKGVYGSPKVRMVLKLPNTAELFLKSLNSKLRSQVKKPLRDGLTVQLGGDELISDFYLVFSEHMRDLGSPVHSRKWIESVMKNYDENARIGLVFTPDRKLAAAGIILLHGDIVSIPWASSLRKYNRLNSNMLLYWTFLAFAIDNGYRYFDFGRSTPGEGTYKFKKQWGANPAPLNWIEKSYVNSVVKNKSTVINSTVRKRIEHIWRMLPLSVCNIFGSVIRKYISL